MSVLTRIQANPEIGSNNPTYVSNLVSQAKRIAARACHLPRFPELSQGYSKSKINPTTDLSDLPTNEIWISVNGSDFHAIELTLENCTTGAKTAEELQAQIRAEETSNYYYGFNEVTVEYDDTVDACYYTITSGRYGEDSSIICDCTSSKTDVCRYMQLGLKYGGTEEIGGVLDEEMEDAAVMIAEILYRKLGLEGLSSGTVPGDISFTEFEKYPLLYEIILNRRRIW